MRDWQVGDPVGDGNDIGVPDTRYMGYLRDDEEDEDDIVDDFKSRLNRSKYLYDNENYEKAFFLLKLCFKDYKKMNRHQKSQIREQPFNQYWIIDLCCKTSNMHGDEYWTVFEIIKEHTLKVNLCLDCDNLYPIDYDYCIECGKELTKPFIKTPEALAEEITDILHGRVVDEITISELATRSLILMKSNDSRIVKIDGGFGPLDFIFEKEHKYFKTIYRCFYIPDAGPRIFEDLEVTHDHEKLLKTDSFKKLIKGTENKTGFTFKNCDGGYGFELDSNRFDFIFNDKIDVIVRFDMGNNQIAVYDIDLDNMQLSKEYRVY